MERQPLIYNGKRKNWLKTAEKASGTVIGPFFLPVGRASLIF
jgi:hypothetical protein